MGNTKSNLNIQKDEILFNDPPILYTSMEDEWWNETFVFHYYDQDQERLSPYWNLFKYNNLGLVKAVNDKDYMEMPLFCTGNFEYNYNRITFLKFFKDLFEIDVIKPQIWDFDFSLLLLPKSIFNEILCFINKYKLNHQQDLIFYIIAKTQIFYKDVIRFRESHTQKKKNRDLDNELRNTIEVIERLESVCHYKSKKLKSSKLLHITFVFQDDKFKITNPMLTNEFVRYFKVNYENGNLKNWKNNLEEKFQKFIKIERNIDFKFHLAKSLYQFLVETKTFELEKNFPYPNRLMECIGKIIEFGLIPIQDFDLSKDMKIRTVRNWIKLH